MVVAVGSVQFDFRGNLILEGDICGLVPNRYLQRAVRLLLGFLWGNRNARILGATAGEKVFLLMGVMFMVITSFVGFFTLNTLLQKKGYTVSCFLRRNCKTIVQPASQRTSAFVFFLQIGQEWA